MEGIIKVSPELLTSTAGEFNNKGTAINQLTSEMMSLVTGLSSAWEGEAATAYMTKFRELDDDIQKIVRMVHEHSKDLEEMARIYTDADRKGVDEASGLSSNVIM